MLPTGFWCHRRTFMAVQLTLCSQRAGALDTVRSMLRILWQALARRPGWKLKTTRQLSLGDDAPHGMVPSLKWRNTAGASIHSSVGKMLPSRSCCLPLRLGQAEAIPLTVDGIKKFCLKAERRGQQEPCEIMQ